MGEILTAAEKCVAPLVPIDVAELRDRLRDHPKLLAELAEIFRDDAPTTNRKNPGGCYAQRRTRIGDGVTRVEGRRVSVVCIARGGSSAAIGNHGPLRKTCGSAAGFRNSSERMGCG